MNTLFARQPLPKSIFLAGPTPRVRPGRPPVPSWRPDALKILEHTLHFDGSVLVPEAEDWKPHSDYTGQVTWEWEGLNLATVVAFWVPRELPDMPALTTNIEFGALAASGKLVLGAPPEASSMKYLDSLAKRFAISRFETLFDTLEAAVEMTRRPFGARSTPT